jgi:chromosome segregation protein
VHLKSVTLKGFKSFPERTRLDFGPGVSVVVGPNGSGKSNVTDAVLWAMGEQSPLAVRGQSMQDVIFGGGRGVQARSAAEVEIVLENSDGGVDLPLSEISIVRRLDRAGEGGYWLNGARCRLTDVIEALSDTGLGKEAHSVISQGRVEQIVTSKPRDRRLLIEEAAGLGKHRKRRRRAQLKLERTQENLDRALDVEREARTRLRPLKRQSEAAELHRRLERQVLEARWDLARDALRSRAAELGQAEIRVSGAREARSGLEAELQATIERRGLAERALQERADRHDAVARGLYGARSALERLELRAEQAGASALQLERRIERGRLELDALSATAAGDGEGQGGVADGGAIVALEGELAEIEAGRELQIEREVAELKDSLEGQAAVVERMQQLLAASRSAQELADNQADGARERLAVAERGVQDVRREAARIGAELAGANQFLHSHAGVSGEQAGSPSVLSDELGVREGYELALAAALGGRLDARLVKDLAGAEALLDGAGPDGGTALLANQGAVAVAASPAPPQQGAAPSTGALRLLDLVSGPPPVVELARRLLSDAWVVERLEDLPSDFSGIAVTRSGRVWFASWGEVRQLSEGGTERVLARRNERDRLIAALERAAHAEDAARAASEAALADMHAREDARAQAETELREAGRALAEAVESRHRTEWLMEQRASAPGEGPLAVRRAELEGELAAERRQAERIELERIERLARLELLRAQEASDTALAPSCERLAAALKSAAEAVRERAAELELELAQDREAGERMAGELRACAGAEAEIQTRLRGAGELVTEAEVSAQRLRDQAAEAGTEVQAIAERLELTPSEPAEALDEEQAQALLSRVERLERRREQLGPVNPLAQEEYSEALAHVEEMEGRRTDLETALRELRGVIRDTDRQIQETFQETFQAAASNFEELVGDVFPGGSGRLRLVSEEQAPRPVLGGQPLDAGSSSNGGTATADGAGDGDAAAIEAAAEAEAGLEHGEEEDLLGVEIEITPAGKSTKRLSLLSGGEKSMTALAFLFAVFLARPCPFYVLDEVEAALDDLNLDRFLTLLRRYSDRAQFIVITHQKRTMEAADWLYGVSMGGDGVSKVLSRRLPAEEAQETRVSEVAGVA